MKQLVMPKRIAIRLINFIWYSTALLIVLAAMTVALGRELMPKINFDNEQLTQYISRKVDAEITFTHLRGQWVKLFPEFSADSVTIHTPQFSITLQNLRMDVDFVRSLLQRSPVFDRLELGSAQVEYQKNSGTPTQPVDMEKSWRIVYLLLNKNIRIQNMDVSWQDKTQQRRLHMQDFRVEQTLLNKRVFIRIANPEGNETASITGTLSGDTLTGSNGNLYLDLQHWPLQAWPLQEWLPKNTGAAGSHWLEAAWRANGNIWLHWQGIDKADAVANVQIAPQASSHAGTLPDNISASLSGTWNRSSGSKIDIHQLQLLRQDTSRTLLEHTQLYLQDPQHWRVQTAAFTLDNLADLQDFLPDGLAKNLLTYLHPTGTLRNVDLAWDNTQTLAERMQLRFNADNLSTGAWHGVPAFTQVSGYLQSGINYGFIDLDSQNGFSMLYPEIYRQPMMFQRATGRVQWQWLADEKAVLVGSDHAALSGEAGEANGNFWLYLPLPGSERHHEMNLNIGLRNSKARYREHFLPYTLPENLLAWLHNAIGEADISDAGFIYRGPLSGRENFSRAVQFYANFNNGDLQFDPAWPRLTGLQGKALVDDGEVSVRTNGGQLYNTAIEAAMVNVNRVNNGMAVSVNARAKGYATDGLRVLRETPLRKSLGNSFDQWSMPQGLLSAAVQLQIPLTGADIPPRENLQISLFDTQLVMDDLRLQFDGIQGDITYQTDKGLNAAALQAMLFKQPVTLKIDSKKTAQQLTVNVSGKGKASISDVAQWSRLRPLQLPTGDFDYQADLTLGPFGKTASDRTGQLRISSDMQQTVLPLPAPLAKQAGEKTPLDLTVDLYRNNRQDYRLDYNRKISGALSMRNGAFFSGDITVLGQTAQLPEHPGPLKIHGQLPDGNLQPWLDLVGTYNKLPQPEKSTEELYPVFAFTMNEATWRDLKFPALRLNIAHENDAWNIQFNSSHANGHVNFYDNVPQNDNPRVPELVLNELKIQHEKQPETAETFGTQPNTFNNVNFAEIPSFDIRIDHLIYNDMDVGNIQTQLRSSEQALKFTELQMTGPGFAVRGKDSSSRAALIWSHNADGMYQSEFHGMLHMQGEQPALKHLGLDPFVRGENIYLASDLAWTGSPLDFKMENLFGRVQTHGHNGKYLQANPNAAMQAISVVNIANWARRLRLDFSDLTSDGISFDQYEAELTFNNGDMTFTQPLTMKSPSSSMVMSGVSHLNTSQLDLKLTATLPVSSNATWITALAGGLPAAAGVYLVSKIFGDQIESITSLTYSITGPSADPDIRFERLAAPKKKSAQ